MKLGNAVHLRLITLPLLAAAETIRVFPKAVLTEMMPLFSRVTDRVRSELSFMILPAEISHR